MDDACISEVARSAPAISAHRGGGETGPSGTYEAYRSALAAGAEYVEFDVRRTLDGTLVAFHRARLEWGRAVAAVSYARLCDLAGYEVPRMAELMQLLAGRAMGHVDLKETSRADVIVRQAVEALGLAGSSSRRARMRWRRCSNAASRPSPLGSPSAVMWPRRRIHGAAAARAGAHPAGPRGGQPGDVAVVHHRLARTGGAMRRRGIKTMVWTVNADQALTGWLASPNVDVLVTDRPARAIALRRRLGGPGDDLPSGPGTSVRRRK